MSFDGKFPGAGNRYRKHGGLRTLVGSVKAMPKALACLALLALIPVSASAADWPTYHGDNTRQGNDTADLGLGSATAAWTSAALDGSVYGQPVIVGSQVVVATENDTVYSLNPATGAVQWSTHLGTPRTTFPACGNIMPLGITGTPVIDAGNVFVVAEIETSSTPLTLDFQMASLNLTTGALNWMHSIAPADPVWPANAQYEQQRAALLATNGRIYVGLGGLAGDCGTYHGYVLSYAENNTGAVTYWAAAEVPGISGDNRGAVWAAGGLSQDPAGFIYAGTGNSSQTSSTSAYDYSDGVIKLDPNALAPGAPADYFAPGNWYADNGGDVDLGSVVPLQLPNNRVFIAGKSGMGYLLNTASLGHIGGQMAINRVCSATNDAAFGSQAYGNGVVYVGCSDGLVAVQINSANNNFSILWHNTTDVIDRPPTFAGGLVWALNSSTLVAFNPTNGAKVMSFPIPGVNHFATPSAANNQLYVATGTHVYAFAGNGCFIEPGPRLLADFSGAGKADLAAVGTSGTCMFVSSGTAFALPKSWASVPFFGGRATLAGDVTGDGKADLVAVNNTSVWVMPSTGTGFGPPAQWSNVPFYGTRGTFVADVNGDGKKDLVAVNDNSVWVMLSTGTTFGPPIPWSTTLFYGNVTTLVADVSGDGKADLVAVNRDSTWVMTSTGMTFSAPALWTSTPFYGNRATIAADVNGDAKVDLIASNNTSTWVMASTGTGFSAPTLWSSTPFYGNYATLAADVTGDLKADLVADNTDGVWVMTSTGTAFSAPSSWFIGLA
ncbi:MAG TPA: FG-GAP-like repeat-containing protein [Candidatus Dormibacteraeota bacterium]|nr:FG-GAP-like repeat-containing protein [Candidatus Dormibacteraeota bacterium]